MSDNTRIQTGAGDNIATDDVNGVKHQRVKVQYGDDGSATDASIINRFPINARFDDSPNLDAFSRLRISSLSTIFDSKLIYDKQPLFWDEVVSNGTSTYTNSTVVLDTNANNGYVIRQTKSRINYEPGQSQLILLTGIIKPQLNTTKYIGYFNTSIVAPYTDNRDGIYFKSVDNTVYAVVANDGTENAIAQSSWNIDKLDGTGSSGVTINWDFAQIFIIDFAWLGVGRVRLGIIYGGKIIYVHEFLHQNSLTGPYCRYPNHSIRYEIRQTSAGSGTMTQICCAVVSEGGLDDSSILLAGNTGTSGKSASVSGTEYGMLGFRLKDTHLYSNVSFDDISILCTSNDNYRWSMILNPTVSNNPIYSDVDNSCLQIAIGDNNTITGGTYLHTSYGSQNNSLQEPSFKSLLRMGSNINGDRDTVWFAITPLSASLTYFAATAWRELK